MTMNTPRFESDEFLLQFDEARQLGISVLPLQSPANVDAAVLDLICGLENGAIIPWNISRPRLIPDLLENEIQSGDPSRSRLRSTKRPLFISTRLACSVRTQWQKQSRRFMQSQYLR